MSLLKAWLKDLPDPGPDTGSPPEKSNLSSLVEFINRKRDHQSKQSEAERQKRKAAARAYERVKRGA